MYLHGILDTVTQWAGDTARSGVAAYRTKESGFNQRYALLKRTPPPAHATPQMKTEYQALVKEAQGIAGKLAWINARIKEVEQITGATLGELGVLPLIPVAVVSAIAGITYLIGKIIARVDNYAREVKGLPPAPETGLFQEAGAAAARVMWPLAIVAGLFMFGPQLIKRGRR